MSSDFLLDTGIKSCRPRKMRIVRQDFISHGSLWAVAMFAWGAYVLVGYHEEFCCEVPDSV